MVLGRGPGQGQLGGAGATLNRRGGGGLGAVGQGGVAGNLREWGLSFIIVGTQLGKANISWFFTVQENDNSELYK